MADVCAVSVAEAISDLRIEAQQRQLVLVDLLLERGVLTRADLAQWEQHDTKQYAFKIDHACRGGHEVWADCAACADAVEKRV
jgi:hypothetical protein